MEKQDFYDNKNRVNSAFPDFELIPLKRLQPSWVLTHAPCRTLVIAP